MKAVYYEKVSSEIENILNRFVGEQNDQETREKIAYEIKCFLEKEGIDYDCVNTYTPIEMVDQGLVKIEIDNECYPFPIIKTIQEIGESNFEKYMDMWEAGSLSFCDTIILFQYLINEGIVWDIANRNYLICAEDLIVNGFCTLSHKKTIGSKIWGNPEIPSKFDIKPGSIGTDEYVEELKKLDLLKKKKEFFTKMKDEPFMMPVEWVKKNILGMKD